MNLQVGIFVALLVVEFFAVRIDSKLGRIFRKHFGLTRKNVWNGGNLCWIYVPEK